MNILGKETASKDQLLEWVRSKNPNMLAIELLDTYWNIAKEHGVNPVVVYCQSMKETGYMKFGGVLDESFHNPCGLKTPLGGGDYDKEAHTRFKDWNEGITAQCEHLALYAGKEGYPLENPKDPRHFKYLLGTAPTVEDLSGRWAGKTYGYDIVKMCDEVSSIVLEEESVEVEIPENDKNIEVPPIVIEENSNKNNHLVFELLNKIIKFILKLFKK